MTARIPLFEFMPYGAPELREAATRHMIRALAIASLVWLAVFALGTVSGGWVHDVAPAKKVDILPPIEIMPPPPLAKPPGATAPRVAPKVAPPKSGDAVPVRDTKSVMDRTIASQKEMGSEPVTAPPGDGTVPRLAPPPDEPLPRWGDYVPTEELPTLMKETAPEYPDIAREAGIEGRVIVRVLVGKDGSVLDAQVDPRFSVPMLNEAALTVAWKLVFRPARSNGHPVAVWVAKPYVFRLH